MNQIKRFIGLLKADKSDILKIYLFAIFSGLLSLTLPLGIQAIIGFLGGGRMSSSWVVLVTLVIIGVALGGFFQVLQLSLSERIQQKIFIRSAFEFATRIPRVKLDKLTKSYLPEIINRFFDTLTIQKGLSKILIDFSTAIMQTIFGLLLLSVYHPFFIFISISVPILLFIIIRFTGARGLRTSIQESANKYEVAHWLEEIARVLETFKLAGKTNLPIEKTDELVVNYIQNRKKHFRVLITQYISMISFKLIITSSLIIVGSLLVIHQQMNVGQFIAAEIIIILVIESISKLMSSMESIYDVLTAVDKISAVVDLPLERIDGYSFDRFHEDFKGLDIQIKNLEYKFMGEDKNTIDNMTLDIKAGEKVCLSGFNASGKATLLHLISGLYSAYSGSISFNNVNIKSINIDELRAVIGDSLKEEDIFIGTLYENISLGRENVSFEQVNKAIKLVELETYVNDQLGGLNAKLTASGKTLPKSIVIKILLARAIVHQPDIILLEDSFNRLKKACKYKYFSHICSHDNKATVIAITNDKEILSYFDRFILMQDGKVIYDGDLENLEKTEFFNLIFE